MKMFSQQDKMAYDLARSIDGVTVKDSILDVELKSRQLAISGIFRDFLFLMCSELILMYVAFMMFEASRYEIVVLVLVPILFMANTFVQYAWHKINDAYFRRIWLRSIIAGQATSQVQKSFLEKLIDAEAFQKFSDIPKATHTYIGSLAEEISDKIDNGEIRE